MHSPAVRSARWLRRATALAAAVGLILLASLAPAAAFTRSAAARSAAARSAATQQTAATRQAASSCPAPPTAPKLGVTVTGPEMYIPGTKDSHYSCPSTVTVTQTKDLSNQMVKVSWTGFTPSKGVPYQITTTTYPVELAECPGDSPGSEPADLSKCYWAANAGQVYTNGKDGASNDVYATSTPQGTGFADIQIETFLQNQQLGCSATHDCSLLVLPADGGVPIPSGTSPTACDDHSKDNGSFPYGYATAQSAFVVPNTFAGDACAWQDRIVIPLHFSPIATACGFHNPVFSVAGSPLMVRAMTSWQSGLCQGAHPDPYAFDGSVGEPQARQVFQLGGDDDVALTTDPLVGPGKHPYTYAPVGITATSLAYWVDDVKTGEPYTNLKLTPLLLAKMLTQSYEYGESPPGYACTPAELQHPDPGLIPKCDPGVLHDPQNVLADPEFRQLNPGLQVDELQPPTVGVPTVPQGNTDMTFETTRWIAADPASTSFLSGHVDNWGEHVNTFYLNTQYPTEQFVGQDPDGAPGFTYLPVNTLTRVVGYLANDYTPGVDWELPVVDQPGVYSGFPPEIPGQRQLFALLDEADTAAFMMPVMKLENAAGDFVGPTPAGMAAAVKNMVPNGGNGITKEYNETSKDAAAYPLTMVVYAAVPTGGISHTKAAAIARWLDYAAGAGQRQGMLPGQLPPGYLPLTSSMRAQTRKAADEVLHQTGDHSSGKNGKGSGNGNGNGGGGGSGGNGSGGGSGSGSNGSPGNSSPSGSGSPGSVANASFSSPFSGTGRLVLVILLIVGGLLALAGPTAVVLGKPGGRAAVIAGWHRVLALRHGPAFLRGRKKP